MCVYVCVCVWLVCVRVCLARVCVRLCLRIGNTSSLPSVTVRTQSPPGGAEALCFLFKCYLYIYLNSLRAQLNEWMKELYTLYLDRETRRSSPGCVLRRSMVNNTLGDDSLVRIRRGKHSTSRIKTQVFTWDFCYFSQRSLHSTCRHRRVMRWGWTCNTIFFTTNKSNQISNPYTAIDLRSLCAGLIINYEMF